VAGSRRRWQSVEGCAGEGGRPAIVGSISEVGGVDGAKGVPEAAVDGKAASATKEAASSVLQQSLRRAVAWRRTKAGRSGQRSVLGVEVDSERRSRVGEHSAAVAVKRRRKVRLAAAAKLCLEIDPWSYIWTLEIITSRVPEFLKICIHVDHVIENTFSFGSVA
jgi:hypothetical protein